MNRTTWAMGLAVALLAACGDGAPPPSGAPAETAGEALRRDDAEIAKRLAEQKADVEAQNEAARVARDKAERVNALQAAATKWVAAVEAAMTVGRSSLGPAIDRMNGARQELAAVETNGCTAAVKSAMLAAADTTLAAFNQFRSESGAASEASKAKLSEASQAFLATDAQLAACR
jgi:hypothetical protein